MLFLTVFESRQGNSPRIASQQYRTSQPNPTNTITIQFSPCFVAADQGEPYTPAGHSQDVQLCQHMPGVLLWFFCALASPNGEGHSRRQQEEHGQCPAQATPTCCRSLAGLSVLPTQFHTEEVPTDPSLVTVRKIFDLLSI